MVPSGFACESAVAVARWLLSHVDFRRGGIPHAGLQDEPVAIPPLFTERTEACSSSLTTDQGHSLSCASTDRWACGSIPLRYCGTTTSTL